MVHKFVLYCGAIWRHRKKLNMGAQVQTIVYTKPENICVKCVALNSVSNFRFTIVAMCHPLFDITCTNLTLHMASCYELAKYFIHVHKNLQSGLGN